MSISRVESPMIIANEARVPDERRVFLATCCAVFSDKVLLLAITESRPHLQCLPVLSCPCLFRLTCASFSNGIRAYQTSHL